MLTDEQIYKIGAAVKPSIRGHLPMYDFARAIEAAINNKDDYSTFVDDIIKLVRRTITSKIGPFDYFKSGSEYTRGAEEMGALILKELRQLAAGNTFNKTTGK